MIFSIEFACLMNLVVTHRVNGDCTPHLHASLSGVMNDCAGIGTGSCFNDSQ